jgi:hypothetical protein
MSGGQKANARVSVGFVIGSIFQGNCFPAAIAILSQGDGRRRGDGAIVHFVGRKMIGVSVRNEAQAAALPAVKKELCAAKLEVIFPLKHPGIIGENESLRVQGTTKRRALQIFVLSPGILERIVQTKTPRMTKIRK